MFIKGLKKIFGDKDDKPMSRLKKKLLLYFILIAIVSISVSAQIILEVSSPKFSRSIRTQFISDVETEIDKETAEKVSKALSNEGRFESINDMRNRMILMLIVVSFSIIGAFNLFARDIVLPMDVLVDATKKLASGDLTAHAPVMSEDEIGQMAGLVNDMNISNQDMIKQIRRELDNYNFTVALAIDQLDHSLENDISDSIFKKKKMKVSDFKRIIESIKEVEKILNKMSNDLTSLHSFMGVYNTYTIPSEVTQKEIDETLKHYQSKNG